MRDRRLDAAAQHPERRDALGADLLSRRHPRHGGDVRVVPGQDAAARRSSAAPAGSIAAISRSASSSAKAVNRARTSASRNA
jgi:hypothetical protein